MSSFFLPATFLEGRSAAIGPIAGQKFLGVFPNNLSVFPDGYGIVEAHVKNDRINCRVLNGLVYCGSINHQFCNIRGVIVARRVIR